MSLCTVFLVLGILTLGAWLAIPAIVFRAARLMGALERFDESRADGAPLPRVSAIVTAHNEERKAEEALRSMLAIEYPDLEIIYVNDRSEDRTGAIADRLCAEDGRAKVLQVTELPEGWFGKNHAAWRAAEAASGEFLLFTDGDAVFAPDALRRMVRYAVAEGVDHLSVVPHVTVRGAMLQACILAAFIFVFFRFRPWKADDPESSAHFGSGPCTLMRAAAYRAMGGHRGVALCPDEDVQLGKLAKRSGLRSRTLSAGTSGRRHGAAVSFEWYESVPQFVRGVQSNFFAHVEYRLSAALGVAAALLWIGTAPFAMALALVIGGAGWPAALFAAAAAICWVQAFLGAAEARYLPASALLFPVAMVVVVFALLRSTFATLLFGVAWGGPPVPLSMLRANRVRFERRTGSRHVGTG